MKITSIGRTPFYGAQNQPIESEKKSKKQEYIDPLANWPLRGLGYTNDIGIAISEIAPTASRLFWVPALMYFGADIYDKYKNKGNEYDPSGKRAFSQAVFQAMASIALPTASGHIGQTAFSYINKIHGEKLSTNAKEQTLRFICNHAESNDIFNPLYSQEELIENFEENFNNFYAHKKRHFKRKNIVVKTYDTLLANCKRGAIANSDRDRIIAFASGEFKNILNTCSDSVQMKSKLEKDIFKLKAWKSLGAFTALVLTVGPIDKFVEHIIIKKFLEPSMDKINFSKIKKITDFGNEKSA
ncbi:hypothetical protein IKL64_05330 [bacterium]|nr:hypothetical protein [bacterium]